MPILRRKEFVHPSATRRPLCSWCNEMMLCTWRIEVQFRVVRSIFLKCDMMEPQPSPTTRVFDNISSPGIIGNGEEMLRVRILGENSRAAKSSACDRFGSMIDTAVAPTVEIPIGNIICIVMEWRNPPIVMIILWSKSRPIWAQMVDSQDEANRSWIL